MSTIPYYLALHTTSPQLGLSITNFAGDSRTQVWDLGRDLSTHLHLHLAKFMQPQNFSDLGFIAVAKGPGGFTGTRIGVVTARTLAQQLNLPLFAISSLASIVWLDKKQYPLDRFFAVQMPARRGQLFTAIYQLAEDGSGLITYLPDTIREAENWQAILDNLNQPYQLISAPAQLGHTVTSTLELAYLSWKQGQSPQWSTALPFYGQHPVR